MNSQPEWDNVSELTEPEFDTISLDLAMFDGPQLIIDPVENGSVNTWLEPRDDDRSIGSLTTVTLPIYNLDGSINRSVHTITARSARLARRRYLERHAIDLTGEEPPKKRTVIDLTKEIIDLTV